MKAYKLLKDTAKCKKGDVFIQEQGWEIYFYSKGGHNMENALESFRYEKVEGNKEWFNRIDDIKSYRLLRDTVNSKKGDIVDFSDSNNRYFNSSDCCDYDESVEMFSIDCVEKQKEWFEPINPEFTL